jgi:hypothetical protein
MTDWYIDQMKRPAYDSPALPISFERIDYQTGTNDFVAVRANEKQNLLKKNSKEAVERSFELNNVLEYWIKTRHVIPTDTIWFKIDKDAVLRSGMKIPEQYLGATDEETKANMPDKMILSLKGKTRLYKNDIMMLDLIAHCNWERPLYIATTVPESSYLNLGKFFLLEGLAYRITPFDWTKLGGSKYGDIDSEKMYVNLMNFKYGGLDNPDLYLDETIRRMCLSQRRLSVQLASRLYNEGKPDKALDIMEKIDAGISDELLPINDAIYGASIETANLFYVLGRRDRAVEILQNTADNYFQRMNWYLSMSDLNLRRSAQDFVDAAKTFSYIMPLAEDYMDKESYNAIQAQWESLCSEFDIRMQ